MELRTGALLASYQNRFTDLLTAAGHTYGVQWTSGHLMLEPLGGGAAVALTLPLGVDSARGCHLTLSADGRWLAIGTRYGDIYLWNLTAPGAARMLVGHTPNGGDGYLAGVNDLSFSPSTSLLRPPLGRMAPCVYKNPALALELRRFDAGLGEVTALAFDANGAQLARRQRGWPHADLGVARP